MRNEIIIYILGIFIVFFILDNILQLTKNKKIKYIYIIIYIIFLYLCLFDRNINNERVFSDGTYIKKWLKLVFKNKIIFKNLIGNIIIFIPMGIFIKNININFVYQIFLSIAIIVCIEFLQYITRIGVFDIIDIFLNILGVLIGYTIGRKKRWNNE